MTERRQEYLKLDALEAVRASRVADEQAKVHLLDEAIEKYSKYLSFEQNKTDDDAWAGLGGAYRRVGDVNLAIDSYQTAYKLNPGSTYGLVNLVSLLAARNRKEDATLLQEYAKKAEGVLRLKVDDGTADHWTWYDIATLQLVRGDVVESLRSFRYAVERTPRNASENFASVLSNLQFLKTYYPEMPGLSDAIDLIARQTAQPHE